MKKPNVIFMLADDLGVRDLGCYGSTFHETPSLDRLAAEGVRFVNAYSSHPVCGPSRSAIMSGCCPWRMGLTGVPGSLDNAGIVWPKVLKEAGYTNYFTGKWHMGERDTVFKNGFDYSVACSGSSGQPSSYYYPYKSEMGSMDVPDLEDGKPGDYLTDKITDKALDFMEKNKDKPFLMYLSFYQTHKPYGLPAQGKKEWVDYFKQKLKTLSEPEGQATRKVVHGPAEAIESLVQRNPEFAGQISSLDENIGRVLDKLKELGIDNNTIIIFTSDQGSVCSISKYDIVESLVSSQAPYRLGKSWLFDGGIRVPLIIKWPGNTVEASVNDTTTFNTDLYPTILDMLKLPLRPDQHRDGISIADAARGKYIPFERTYCWNYPEQHKYLGHEPSVAIRRGDYKLIYWFNDEYVELYNVVDDICEDHDLSGKYPALVQSMLTELRQTLKI